MSSSNHARTTKSILLIVLFIFSFFFFFKFADLLGAWRRVRSRHFIFLLFSFSVGDVFLGGMSVCYHLVSPASRGLFTRAIVESGPCASHAQWRKLEYQDMFARHYFNSVGCTGSGRALVDCIRAVPMKALTGGNTKTPHGFGNGTFPTFSHTVFGPTIDGRPLGLLGVPADLIRSG